jgi:high-affinity nickel-transport protein
LVVVILLSIVVGFAAAAVSGRFEYLNSVGRIIGTSASALFLFLLALLDVLVLISIY